MSDDCGCRDYDRKALYKKFSQHEVCTVDDLLRCMDGAPNNNKIRRAIMLLLRAHYSHPENYGDDYDHLKCYVYGPEGNLHVGFTNEFDDRHPDNFPGIYVGFGGMQLAKLALGGNSGWGEDGSRELLAKGARLTINIHHVTKNLDAYDMAEMSMDLLHALSPFLRDRLKLMAFEVAGYSDDKKAVEAPDRYYDVVLSVEISYSHSVALSLESHRIRQISMRIQPEEAALNQQ